MYGLPSPITSTNSPAPSAAGSITTTSTLPAQRAHPLKPGSAKEIALVNYVDEKILLIERRYGTKFTDIKTNSKQAAGYSTLDQVVADIDPLIDLVWSTGTTTLQTPYMLTFAGHISSYILAFPFSKSLFRITGRLDAAFSTLLDRQSTGGNASIEPRHNVSMTERVRIRSIIEETRVNAVNAASASGHSAQIEDLTDDDTDDDEMMDQDNDIDDEHIAAGIAKIYKATLEILGDRLVE